MKKLLITIVILFTFLEIEICPGQEKLNPEFFIKLQTRTNDRVDTVNLNEIFTYIKPNTNIKINFIKDKMYEVIGIDSPEMLDEILGEIDSLNKIEEKLIDERDYKISLIPEAESTERKKIQDEYNKLIIELVKDPQLELVNKEIQLTLEATIIYKNGKTYYIEIPNYVNTITTIDTSKNNHDKTKVVTSITSRVFRVSTKGFLDNKITDTEIDLINEKLEDGDVVKLEIANNDNKKGIKRKYIKRFVISDYGLKFESSPSVLFINRFSEPKDVDGKAIYPTNFKPAPGVSVVISHIPNPGLGFGTKLLTGFAFGLNVSLLDFEPENNIELGFGFIFCWMNSMVGGGCGLNLNATEKRSYMFISLDFLKTYKTFKPIFSSGEE